MLGFVHPIYAAHLVSGGGWDIIAPSNDPYVPAYWRVDVVDRYGRGGYGERCLARDTEVQNVVATREKSRIHASEGVTGR